MRRDFWSILPLLLSPCLAQPPVIDPNGVLDAASYTAGVVPGGLFVLRGANLPTRLAGASIHFAPVSGEARVDALILSAVNQGGAAQLTAIVPPTLASGDYLVTVTVDGFTSAPVPSAVFVRKFGVMTVPGTGSGRALVQNFAAGRFDLNRFTTGTYAEAQPATTWSPAHPGQLLVVWGTGLGAAVSENRASDTAVIVGGKQSATIFAGRSPEFPGLDVITFELPRDVETGCTVDLEVSAGGLLSNQTTIAIAAAGSDACVHPEISKETLGRLDRGGAAVTGWFVVKSDGHQADFFGFPFLYFDERGVGGFSSYGADQLGDQFSPVTEEGKCRISPYSGTWESLLRGSGATVLDAGPRLWVSNELPEDFLLVRQPGNAYLGAGFLDLAPSRTIAGTGGADIGPFVANLDPSQPVVFRSLPAAIDRNSGATITWSGVTTSLVSLVGLNNAGGAFVCTVGSDRGSLSVPSSVLNRAFPVPGQGKLMVLTTPRPAGSRFTASLTSGGMVDSAVFVSTVAYLEVVAFR